MLRLCLLSAFASLIAGDAIYTDDLARNKFWSLSAGSYSFTPENCIANHFENATLYKRYDIHCDLLHDETCCGLVAVSHSDRSILLVFRGTKSFFKLLEEAEKTVFSKQTAWTAGGKVSKYFNDAMFTIWNGGMKDGFNTLKTNYPDYDIWITGHSIGGAMATLATSYLIQTKQVDQAKIKLLTFGEPRVGNKDFAETFNSQLDYHFRVTHAHDFVPHIPERIFGYHHQKFEVFYHENMKSNAKFTVCKEDEDSHCSDGQWKGDTSISDHLKYFEHDCFEYSENGCK